MKTILAMHEVDDVEHWFNSPKRQAFFDDYGIKVRPFRDPEGDSNMVGVIIETPDMETMDRAMSSEEAQEAMQHDGVRPETLLLLVED